MNSIIFSNEFLNWLRLQNTSAKRNSSLPVIVYIHEGGFFSGSIHSLIRGPHYFMDTQQVIMVLMTYRLGVLGMQLQLVIINILKKRCSCRMPNTYMCLCCLRVARTKSGNVIKCIAHEQRSVMITNVFVIVKANKTGF